MSTSLQILTGFIVGCAGLMRIADSPIPACSAVLLGGFIIMGAVNDLC